MQCINLICLMRLTPIMNSSRKRSIINDEQRRANKLIRTQGGSINIPHDEKEFEVGAILNFGQSVLNPDVSHFNYTLTQFSYADSSYW